MAQLDMREFMHQIIALARDGVRWIENDSEFSVGLQRHSGPAVAIDDRKLGSFSAREPKSGKIKNPNVEMRGIDPRVNWCIRVYAQCFSGGGSTSFGLRFEPSSHRSPTNQVFSCEDRPLSRENEFAQSLGSLDSHCLLLFEVDDRPRPRGRFVGFHSQELAGIAV